MYFAKLLASPFSMSMREHKKALYGNSYANYKLLCIVEKNKFMIRKYSKVYVDCTVT